MEATRVSDARAAGDPAGVKAISLQQPWATLVAMGLKQVETRSWSTKHRGRLAIHATKKLPGSWHPFRDEHFIEALEPACGLNEFGVPDLSKLPTGAVVAFVDVLDVIDTVEQVDALEEFVAIGDMDARELARELAFGDFTPGRFAWVLGHVTPLRPPGFAFRGAQRLWEFPRVAAFMASNLVVPQPLTRAEVERKTNHHGYPGSGRGWA
jgi:hypothetical protein